MPVAPKFASGKFAYGVCDICGVSYRLLELRATTVRARNTGLLACPICWDLDHPQNFLPEHVHIDPEALRNPRSDDFYASRIQRHWRPADSLILHMAIGAVEVHT